MKVANKTQQKVLAASISICSHNNSGRWVTSGSAAAAASSEQDVSSNRPKPFCWVHMEGRDNRWGHMSLEVHVAPESLEGPEKRSQEGLDREFDTINSLAGPCFIVVHSFLLVINLMGSCFLTQTHTYRLANHSLKWRVCKVHATPVFLVKREHNKYGVIYDWL